MGTTEEHEEVIRPSAYRGSTSRRGPAPVVLGCAVVIGLLTLGLWLGGVLPAPQAADRTNGADPALAGPSRSVQRRDGGGDAKHLVRHRISLLKGPEPGRSRAAAVLVRMQGTAVPVLTEVVEEGFPDAAPHAIRVLGQIGPNASGAVPVLVRCLKNPTLRNPAAGALGAIGPAASEAALPLLLVIESDQDDTEVALVAVEKINPEAGRHCRRLRAIDQEQRVLASEEQLENTRFRNAQASGDIDGVRRAGVRLEQIAQRRATLASQAEQVLRLAEGACRQLPAP